MLLGGTKKPVAVLWEELPLVVYGRELLPVSYFNWMC